MPVAAPSIRLHGTTATFVAESNAEVFYTLDGREPTANSNRTPPDSAVELGYRNLVVKAVAMMNGERSPVASALYVYTPRPLVITPEDGVFENAVNVTFQSEHDDIRYTTDGSVPSRNSAQYDGPFRLTQEGTTVVTAAMFVSGRLVGDVVRRSYEIAQAKLTEPKVTPAGGCYPIPFRITVASEHDVRYTLDGSEPTLQSLRYTAPIVLVQEGPITLCCRSFARTSASAGRRPSSVVCESYHLSMQEYPSGGGQPNSALPLQTQSTTVLPIGNFDFSRVEEERAVDTAENTAAYLMAAQQVHQDAIAERSKLSDDLKRLKTEHQSLLARLDDIRKDLGVASARKAVLLGQVGVQSELVSQAQQKLEALHQDRLDLQQRKFSTEVELSEAERLLRSAALERQELLKQREAMAKQLEATYLDSKKKLASVSPSLEEEVAETVAVVAEQRHEIRLLKETLKTLEKTLERPSAAEGEFLPVAKVVELPVVEAVVPIGKGKMRLITGTTGNGLRKLREEHKVQASIVQRGDELAIRVYGHARGVHNLVTDVGKLLNEA